MEIELENLKKFSEDDKQEKLVIYELEFQPNEDPNVKFRAKARTQGDCPCRLWLILALVNAAILTLMVFLILLLLIDVGPVPPYQNYGQQCRSAQCDAAKGLMCRNRGSSMICQCPSDRWFWYNQTKCQECPPHWIVGNNGTGCYFVSEITLNFTDANRWCQNRQSRLLEITNDKLFVALQSINDFHFRLNDFYWIGLREIGPRKNIYRWISSTQQFSSMNYFCSGQPAQRYNFYFQEYDQCIGLEIPSNSSACFRDWTCPNVARFLCELY